MNQLWMEVSIDVDALVPALVNAEIDLVEFVTKILKACPDVAHEIRDYLDTI